MKFLAFRQSQIGDRRQLEKITVSITHCGSPENGCLDSEMHQKRSPIFKKNYVLWTRTINTVAIQDKQGTCKHIPHGRMQLIVFKLCHLFTWMGLFMPLDFESTQKATAKQSQWKNCKKRALLADAFRSYKLSVMPSSGRDWTDCQVKCTLCLLSSDKLTKPIWILWECHFSQGPHLSSFLTWDLLSLNWSNLLSHI